MSNRQKAENIVDSVLKWVDTAGFFSGKGKNRKLVFKSLIDKRTLNVSSVMETMIDEVEKLIKTDLLE